MLRPIFRQRLVSLYVNGGEGNALEVLLGAESLDDLLNRMDAVERVSDQDARVLREVKHFGGEVKQRKIRLDRARAAQAQVVADKADQRRSIEGQLAERQRLLSSIKSEIASLQAAERLRQQRLEAQARARLATASVQRQGDAEFQQAAEFDPLRSKSRSPLPRTPATAASSGSRCSSSVCPTCGAVRARRASTAPV